MNLSNKEAIEILEELQADLIKQNYEESDIVGYVAIGIGIDAIMKQIPIKISNQSWWLECPVCKTMKANINDKYCCECGQSLDWGEQNA